MARTTPDRVVQHRLKFRSWGGPRPSAGRKPIGKHPKVRRVARPVFPSSKPLLVTMRLRAGLPSLRRRREFAVLLDAFAKARERFGFRLVHHSVQSNHVHLICEAEDRRALARGMQGLMIRVAKRVNRLWKRKGSVFSDRYHARVLGTPTEMRNALIYVLHNVKKHRRSAARALDEYASTRMFDGWRERVRAATEAVRRSVARAQTWLVREGWSRAGEISVHHRPAAE